MFLNHPVLFKLFKLLNKREEFIDNGLLSKSLKLFGIGKLMNFGQRVCLTRTVTKMNKRHNSYLFLHELAVDTGVQNFNEKEVIGKWFSGDPSLQQPS